MPNDQSPAGAALDTNERTNSYEEQSVSADHTVRRLRVWRTAKLLSVRELADAAGVTPKTLTDLEYGRRTPGYATMRRICGALGVAPHEIAEFVAALDAHAARPQRPATEREK